MVFCQSGDYCFVCPRLPVIHKMYDFLPPDQWTAILCSYLAICLLLHLESTSLHTWHFPYSSCYPCCTQSSKQKPARSRLLTTQARGGRCFSCFCLTYTVWKTWQNDQGGPGETRGLINKSTAFSTPSWAPGSWESGLCYLASYSQGLGSSFPIGKTDSNR